jgi:3-hydroxyacyl-CoA dehydrogenase/enoyl-CoA hydratase/3-hydroxybutyryl-CoA epimerase
MHPIPQRYPYRNLPKSIDKDRYWIAFLFSCRKMPLVEVIVGKETSDKTLAAAIDYVIAIRKVQ